MPNYSTYFPVSVVGCSGGRMSKRKHSEESPTTSSGHDTEAALMQWCRSYFDSLSNKLGFERFSPEEGGRGYL